MPPQTATTPGASVTSRALSILAAFSAQRRELTLSEIARATGLPLTTAHRLVAELATWGALERDERGRYRIGLRLWEIGALAPRTVGLREAALPFLEDLYEATHENVHLAVRDGDEALYLERISGRDSVRVISRVGGRLPLHATGVGLVLLAFAEVEAQERVLAQPLRRFTDRTVTAPDELRRILAEVRRTGVAVSHGYLEETALSVAAPVRDRSGQVVAALSIVVPMTCAPGPFLPAVTAAARGVSRALGAPLPR